MAGRVEGKVILVTGAATGIGLATAKLLVAEGATVVMTDLTAGRLETEAASLGDKASWHVQDVRDEDRWIDVIGETVRRHGKLDGLVNNAGVGNFGTIEDFTLEEFRFVMAVNVEGVFLGCKHAIRAMKQTGGGSIVNISSVAGMIGAPEAPAYCASKGAVRLMTKSVAVYCATAGMNIRVNSVHPSYLNTEMVRGAIAASRDPERMRKRVEKAAPLGRLGEPEDAAYAILYLLSDESRFVTGAEQLVDGGTTAW